MFKQISQEQDVPVFNNSFALDRMINQTSMAGDATKLKQALQRLKGFVTSQHAELTEQQRATLNTMAAKQRNRGPAVWTAEVDELFSAVTGDVTRVATERSEARRALSLIHI